MGFDVVTILLVIILVIIVWGLKKILEAIENSNARIEVSFNNKIQQLQCAIKYLKLDNLLNTSNEVANCKENICENEHFVQQFGYCKIVKITDKHSGEVTQVSYDEFGRKSSTQTYSGGVLRYAMEYEDDRLARGIEYGLGGEISFEYEYDEADEIAKKIEYIYGEDGKLDGRKETNYKEVKCI